MISEWPVSEEGPRMRREPRVLARSGDAARRLADAAADLFLPDSARLTDRVRAFASAMISDLVGAVEGEMHARIGVILSERFGAASLATPEAPVVLALLTESGVIRHAPLVELLLRRADGFILAERLSPARDGGGLPTRDEDPEVRAAAVALLVAQARRVDRFGAPALLFDDLSAELAHWLVWRVAAALRRHLRDAHGIENPTADAAIAAAAGDVLAAHDEGRGLDATAWWLAFRLRAGGRIDGDLLVALAEGGETVAFTAALAAAARAPASEMWKLVADPADGRLALALRAADVGREAAARILVLLLPSQADPVEEFASFDASDVPSAAAALAPLTLDPAYRTAISELDR